MLTPSLKAQLARGSGSAFFIKVGGAGVSLGMHVLLARLLGAKSFGDYIYVITWVNVLSLLVKAGMDTASQRFIVEYSNRGQWGELRGFLGTGRWTNWILGLGTGLVMAGVAVLLRAKIGESLMAAFCAGAVLLPLVARMQVLEAGLRACKRIVSAQAPQELLRPVLIVGAVAAGTFWLDGRLQPFQAVGVNAGTTLLILVLAFVLLRRALPAEVFKARPASRRAEWWSVGFSLMATEGFYLVISQADIIMIGAFLGTESAGVYAVASRLAALVSFGIIAVNTIVAPLISELHTQEKRGELKSLLRTSALWIALVSVPVAALLALAGRWVLGWFGPEFVAGYPVLLIMSAGQIINALCGSVGALMNMTGHHKRVARIVGITAGANVPLNAVAILLMGMSGAAIVSAVSTVVWNAAMLVFVIKKMGINPTAFQSSRR
jgi:O-antigen/teichoic acid export membrane protein